MRCASSGRRRPSRNSRCAARRVIVLSHFDRPGGKVVPSMSLRPLAVPLAEAIGRPVAFAKDCIGEGAIAAIGSMKDGDVILLENTRFHADEEKNDARVRESAGEARRSLRQRRVLRGAPGACVDRRPGAHPARLRRDGRWQAELVQLHKALLRAPSGRWWRSSAARRSRPRSTCLIIWPRSSTCWSSAALWRTRSWRRRAIRSGSRWWSWICAKRREKSSVRRCMLPSDVVVAKEFTQCPFAHHRARRRRPDTR